jgi:hypothetical protein
MSKNRVARPWAIPRDPSTPICSAQDDRPCNPDNFVFQERAHGNAKNDER